MTEAEAGGGRRAAVLGGSVCGLQLREREEAWVAGWPWLSPAASGLGLTHCVHIHGSLKSPPGLVPQHLQPELHGGQEGGVDAGQSKGAAVAAAGGPTELALTQAPGASISQVPALPGPPGS